MSIDETNRPDDHPSEDAQEDVHDHTVATTLHNLASQPTSDQSNNNPCNKSHVNPPWVRSNSDNLHLTPSILKYRTPA